MVRTEIVLDATKVVLAVILVMPMGIARNRVDDCAEALCYFCTNRRAVSRSRDAFAEQSMRGLSFNCFSP
jgi:hypothetical protein